MKAGDSLPVVAQLRSCGKLSWSKSQASSSTSSWPSLWITSTMFFHLCLQTGFLLKAKQMAPGTCFSPLYSRGTNVSFMQVPRPSPGF